MNDTKNPFADAWNEDMANGAGPQESAVDRAPTPARDAVRAADESVDGAGKGGDEYAQGFGAALNGEPQGEKPKDFKTKFAEARAKALANPNDKSLRVFDHNGKKYTTDLASERKASKPGPAKQVSYEPPAGKAPYKPSDSDVPDSTPMVNKTGSFTPADGQRTSKPTQSNGIPIGVLGRESTKDAVGENKFMGRTGK